MVTIDKESGFCFGVVTAIRKAEEELHQSGHLYCLGDIVHNGQEVERLGNMGLVTIDYEEFRQLHNAKVLLRAHGEPPSTYRIAEENNIEIIDASCPVVRNLQKRIRQTYERLQNEEEILRGQIVIFGKKGHAETIGLEGQTDNTAVVVETADDLDKIDYGRAIYLFAQTTKSAEMFHLLISDIEQRRETHMHRWCAKEKPMFEWHDTICGQVRNRTHHLQEFARRNDKIVFVGGKNSSNGKVLYEQCRLANPETLFISDAAEITDSYKASCRGKNIGICGATSTPLWLMEACAQRLKD
ncbi:MAG: 4-hydroxy-3-methylbut-2-enyl diphosphate reductase [Paludibacter sp.]|nr:4-hydroxy-3-methylbut-2-enyl diphosphate reductase [Bacteroidales bacterium]MCM1069725.1 4-hydroxy-3-methylbut-2-enyl diphosphate reductase [Prevotella sp.]MCM1354410.1 4-hydroxy-3-methylbut-2-enyl diphosphate reductase [Bacteroides sp.]MCM1443252.1 4-hydroxy-3-methylbut-2-enyl diphosphate reductase [Muribaculum sp.]MCM1482444.1 4-hydroxy-3-methylbut-2-enyl diphosphate reductase [Paludibacter sp.]